MTLTNIKNKEQGFTIVELLIVIIVIGILAALVLVGYNNVQAQARDTANAANANTVEKAVETFKTTSDQAIYPRNDTSANFQTDINAMKINNTTSNTLNVPTTISDNLSTSAPDSSNKKRIQYVYCPTSATASTATGAKIVYYKEVGGTLTTLVTGTGC